MVRWAGPRAHDKGGNDETHSSSSFGSCSIGCRSFGCIFSHRHGHGTVLRKQGRQRRRQAAARSRQKQLREEMQEGRLRKQGSQHRGQAAARGGEEQLYGEMQEGCVSGGTSRDVAGFCYFISNGVACSKMFGQKRILCSAQIRQLPASNIRGQRARQGRLLSNAQPGFRYCIATASSRAPRPCDL